MDREQKRNRKYDKSVYRALVLVTQFGINMLVPICMLSALGIWLDHRFGTAYWTVLLFFVGAVAGGQNIFRMAKGVYRENREKEQGSVHEDNRDTETQK